MTVEVQFGTRTASCPPLEANTSYARTAPLLDHPRGPRVDPREPLAVPRRQSDPATITADQSHVASDGYSTCTVETPKLKRK